MNYFHKQGRKLAFLKHGLPNLVIKSLTPAKGMQITVSDVDIHHAGV